jgi:hypothetical protein
VIPNDEDGQIALFSAESIFQFREGLIIDRVSDIKGLNLKEGVHWFKSGKVTLKNGLTGLAVLSIKVIDLIGRGGRSS